MDDELLTAYDAQLRGAAEVATALSWEWFGPLIVATFPAGGGFIAWVPRDAQRGADAEHLVGAALARLVADPTIREVEWKTRAHDPLPGLNAALLRHGFVAGQPETVMIGRAETLVTEVPLPAGVTLRTVQDRADLERMRVLYERAAGHPMPAMVDALVASLAQGSGTEVWVAEADGEVVSCGRLEPVAGTRFAGLWGGATRADWRRRGVYRALTAERARSALRLGKTLLQSDSTEFSRPILERAGLRPVTTTTPYVWRRRRERTVVE